MASRGEIASWVGTGVAHAVLAALVVLHHAKPEPVPEAPPPPAIEITLDDGPAARAARPAAPERKHADDRTPTGMMADGPPTAGLLAMASTSQARSSPDHSSGSMNMEGLPAPSASASSGPPASLFVPDQGVIGLTGPGSFSMQTAAAGLDAGTLAQLQERIRHAIQDPLRAHDRAVGALGQGPVVAALEDATRLSPGPSEGNAVFSVRVDASGKVLSLTLEQSSSDFGSWEDIGRQSERALRKKPLHLPPGSHGLAMRVQVRVKIALPSGASHAVTPKVGADEHGGYVGGGFDVSDIGAHPVRVVGATLLDAQDL